MTGFFYIMNMRYRVKEILKNNYHLSTSEINIAMLGHGTSISEAEQYQIAPEAVAEAIYQKYKKEH